MKKYMVELSEFNVYAEIKEVEVERETAEFIFINGMNGRRCKKRSSYENYYNTWEEAKAALYKSQGDRVLRLRNELDRAENRLLDIIGMKNINKPMDESSRLQDTQLPHPSTPK